MRNYIIIGDVMYKYLKISLVIMVLFNILGCPSAEKSTNNGLKALSKKQYTEAIQCFDDAIRIDNKYAKAYVSRGVVLAETNHIDKAINDFMMAVKLDPTIPGTYLSLGLAYANKGNFKQAINEFTKAIEINKSYGDAYYNRGIAYTKIEDFQSALSDITHAISINPANDKYLLVRGNVHFELDNLLLAMKDYISAINLNPKVSKYYSKMGLCLYRAELYSFAIIYCRKANILDPNNEEANEIGKSSIQMLAYEKNLNDVYDEAVVMYLKQQKHGQFIDTQSAANNATQHNNTENEAVVTSSKTKRYEQSHVSAMTKVTLQRPTNKTLNIIVSKDSYFKNNKLPDEIATISSVEIDINGDGKDDILYTSRAHSGSCGSSWAVILRNDNLTYNKPRSYVSCVGDELYLTDEMSHGLKVPCFDNKKLIYNHNLGYFERKT